MSENTRPPAIPFDSDLARRADAPRHLPERIASTVMYHAGPEIGVTTIVGGVGALAIHPVALPIVAALVTVWAVVDRSLRRRVEGRPQRRSEATNTSESDREVGAA